MNLRIPSQMNQLLIFIFFIFIEKKTHINSTGDENKNFMGLDNVYKARLNHSVGLRIQRRMNLIDNYNFYPRSVFTFPFRWMVAHLFLFESH